MSEASPTAGRRRWFGLRLLVFWCGAVVMAFELAGSRVLEQYFGSTIFVWGSLIGMVMAALSLGYFFGGALADRFPRLLVLAGIVSAAGLLLLAARLIAAPVCEPIQAATNLGPRLKPFLCSTAIFFLPSVLLGMVSPFAIRLTTEAVRTVGTTAGRLYALSTLGSLFGTFFTAFFLIAVMGVSSILLCLGVSLVVMAGLGIWLSGSGREAGAIPVIVLGSFVALILALVPASPILQLDGDETLIDEAHSFYNHVVVTEKAWYNGEPARCLRFGPYVQSSIRLGTPRVVPGTTYTELIYLPFLFRRNIQDVLIIGGGGGVVARMFQEDYPHGRITVVEIDGEVVRMAKKHFGLKESEQLECVVADGRGYLRTTPKRFDLIILDAYSIGGRVPAHLVTKEFHQTVRSKLKPGGVVLSNLIATLRGRPSRLFYAELKTMRQVYPEVYVFPKYPRDLDGEYDPQRGISTNLMLLGLSKKLSLTPDAIVRRAEELVSERVIRRDPKRFLERAGHLYPDVDRLAYQAAPILTDDFCPVHLMMPD